MAESVAGEARLKHPSLKEQMTALRDPEKLELFQLIKLDSTLQKWMAAKKDKPTIRMDLASEGKMPDVLSYTSDGFQYGLGPVTLLETSQLLHAAAVGIGDLVENVKKQIPDTETKDILTKIAQTKLSDFERQDILTSVQQHYFKRANRIFDEIKELQKSNSAESASKLPERRDWFNKLMKYSSAEKPENISMPQKKAPFINRGIAKAQAAARSLLSKTYQ